MGGKSIVMLRGPIKDSKQTINESNVSICDGDSSKLLIVFFSLSLVLVFLFVDHEKEEKN